MNKLLVPTIKFWSLWILSSSIGYATGFTIGIGLAPHFGDDFLLLIIPVVMPISGLFMGLGQSIILRRRLRRAWWWVPASAIGLPLGFYLGFWVSDSLPRFFYVYDWIELFIMASIAGICIGVLQWLVAQNKSSDLFRWILFSALSWGIGITISLAIDTNLNISDIDPWYLRDFVSGMLIGAIVGAMNGFCVISIPINSAVKAVELNESISNENAS